MTNGLVLQGIDKRYGQVLAVSDVNLTLPPGQFVCFLGPSGCGKTTLLRIIAGLEMPSAGRVRLDDKDITDRPAHQRNFGMVFQSLALFPHLSVGENIAYSLRIRGVDRAARRRKVEELLELVRMPGLAERHVSQLSGGQRQRVAIARALALEPKLFLLDEPLSALDAKLREAMQVELRLLQKRLGITTILVTHDQREAMTMSDLVVVMDQGRVQQVGPPLDIYRRPANSFVAQFIGISNLLPAVMDGGDRLTVAGALFTVAGERPASGERPMSGGRVTLSIRPEDVHLFAGTQTGPNRLPGTVTFVRDVGASVETYVDVGGETVVQVAAPKDRPPVSAGDMATVELPAESCVLLRE
ncbi:ABC transporter ATP-binding protein [Virgifigura deserti]|uniref:ABC transporter ATP-binding protein n=1 Tax=Virgifigura deserti TaxID=2268457 RepID=UPI003CCC42F7